MKSRGGRRASIRPERGTLPLALFGALPGIDVPPRLAIVDRHVDRALGQRSRPATRLRDPLAIIAGLAMTNVAHRPALATDPRDRRAPPAATGLVTLVRRLVMRLRRRWVGWQPRRALGAVRPRHGATWRCSLVYRTEAAVILLHGWSPMEQSAFRMGHYGVGLLWCVRERGLGTFITFNNERIARREPNGTWFILKTGWKVTPSGWPEVHVQLNGSDGVIVAFRGGSSR
jgi:hypothetical protein